MLHCTKGFAQKKKKKRICKIKKQCTEWEENFVKHMYQIRGWYPEYIKNSYNWITPTTKQSN